MGEPLLGTRLSLSRRPSSYAGQSDLRRQIDKKANDSRPCPRFCQNDDSLLQVVFDRFDKDGRGSISAADARDALEYMGRDVTGEACASWLADKERRSNDNGRNGISFVDFTTA